MDQILTGIAVLCVAFAIWRPFRAVALMCEAIAKYFEALAEGEWPLVDIVDDIDTIGGVALESVNLPREP